MKVIGGKRFSVLTVDLWKNSGHAGKTNDERPSHILLFVKFDLHEGAKGSTAKQKQSVQALLPTMNK